MRFQTNSNNYTVELDINGILPIDIFGASLGQILVEEDVCYPGVDVRSLYSYEKGLLRYESETLLPCVDDKRPKILLVFGNPAVHSVTYGMFFFSKTNCHRHQLWGKLAEAGLVKRYDSSLENNLEKRRDEAKYHRNMIVTGKASKQCLVGMTTFFSLPTRSQEGVEGVENLFGDAVDQIAAMEAERILSYPFSNNATLVFTQKSTWERFCIISGTSPIYWPMHERSARASGEYLEELLSAHSVKCR